MSLEHNSTSKVSSTPSSTKEVGIRKDSLLSLGIFAIVCLLLGIVCWQFRTTLADKVKAFWGQKVRFKYAKVNRDDSVV